MSQICPKCSADTEALEEETDERFCIHEKIMIAGVAALAAAGILSATGTV